jgi:outer membrane lipoprotein-sorting protein
MRRIAALLVAALATVALGGCAGADAQRAQELLRQSSEAMQDAESFRFAGRLSMTGPGGIEISLVIRGGVTQKGGGASHLTMEAEGVPGFPETSVVLRGERAWMNLAGTWTELPSPPAEASAASQFDFTPYVTDVAVESGPVLDGEPTVKIVGVLDTGAFATGMLGQLGSVPGADSGLVPDLSDVLEDTRLVLYLSETTHLPVRGLVDMAMEAEGERVEVRMDFALKGYGKPVQIPRPA